MRQRLELFDFLSILLSKYDLLVRIHTVCCKLVATASALTRKISRSNISNYDHPLAKSCTMSKARSLSLSNLVKLINRVEAIHGIWINPLESFLQLSSVVDAPVIVALHLETGVLIMSIAAPDTGNFEVVNGW